MITDLHSLNMSKKCVYLQWTVKHILLIGPLKKSCKAEDFTVSAIMFTDTTVLLVSGLQENTHKPKIHKL
jgi:hypothetical protein